MEMEEVEHQYGMSSDLRQFLNGRTASLFTTISQQPMAEDLLTITAGGHNDQLAQEQHLEMLISSRHHHLSTSTSTSTDQIPTTATTTIMPPPPPPPPHGGLLLHHHHHHHNHLFGSDSTTAVPNNNLNSSTGSGCLDIADQSGGFGCADGGTGRWPRQETLTLLEIRSRLDSKFKDANQKAPLWDELSRIMCEEHGYQRSGKKCREKFENLYKYYKKTKEGKAGRQDGKHYRFFRQLEALYGESSTTMATNPTTALSEIGANTFPYTTTTHLPNQEVFNHQAPRFYDHDTSLTPSNSSAFNTSSSDDCSDLNAAVALNKRRGKRSWKARVKDFIDGQMRKLMEKQEAWLEKMMSSIEHKEQERMLREEEWRKQEAARIDREHKFWAKERAWIEARDAGLMEALHKLTGIKELKVNCKNQNDNGGETITETDSWGEGEITRLIQLRACMEPRFVEQSGNSELGDDVLWEEISSKMGCFGYERSASECKEKCDMIKNNLVKSKEDQCSKKRKENYDNNNNNSISSSCFYIQNNESICNELEAGGLGLTRSLLTQNGHHIDASDSNAAAGSNMNGNTFRFFMGDHADNLWENNYGLKLSKGDN